MAKYMRRTDAVFAACKVLDMMGGCHMGPLCPDAGCIEVRDIIDQFQMVEIPDDHGKLVDVDSLIKDHWVLSRVVNGNNCAWQETKRLETVPAVISANKEET